MWCGIPLGDTSIKTMGHASSLWDEPGWPLRTFVGERHSFNPCQTSTALGLTSSQSKTQNQPQCGLLSVSHVLYWNRYTRRMRSEDKTRHDLSLTRDQCGVLVVVCCIRLLGYTGSSGILPTTAVWLQCCLYVVKTIVSFDGKNVQPMYTMYIR